MKRVVAAGFVMALALAACGGTGGTGVTSDGMVIASPDGRFELMIPPGTFGDEDPGISIFDIDDPSVFASPGFRVYGYRIEPYGIEFDEPVSLSLRVPYNDSSIGIGLIGIGDTENGFEHLPATYTVSDGEMVIESQLDALAEEFVAWISEPPSTSTEPGIVGGQIVRVEDGCRPRVARGATCTISVPGVSDDVTDVSFSAYPEHFQLVEESGETATFRCTQEGDQVLGGYVTVTDTSYTGFDALLTALNATRMGSDTYTYASRTDCVAGSDDDVTTTTASTAIDLGATFDATDPTGDFLAADDLTARGFESINLDPPAGIDITDVSVTYEPGGTTTIITICFAGDARSLEGAAGHDVVIRAIFREQGEYAFEYSHSGASTFVSSAPEGVTGESEWIADDKLRITISGHVPADGDQVRISAFDRGELVQGDDAEVTIGG